MEFVFIGYISHLFCNRVLWNLIFLMIICKIFGISIFMGKIMEEKNKGTKKPKRNGTRPAKNSGKRIGKSRPEKADNARNRILKQV